MDSDVLFKEQLYRRMNADIRRETQTFIKEIESRIDEDFSEMVKEEAPEMDRVKQPDTVRCGLWRPSGSEGLIRVLQAKVKVLREQLNTLQSDYIKRTDDWKSLQGEMVKVEENSLKAKQNLISTHDQLKKQEKLISTITNHLQIRDRENGVLRKQIESLKRELKQQESNSNANEVRLNRSLEEIERLKEALKKSQHDEKELKDTHRNKQDEFNKILARTEKQKTEIVSAFKKLLYLISNLKKQQGILETTRLISITEEEFNKLLDWTPGFS